MLTGRHFNNTLTRLVLEHVSEVCGPDAVDALLDQARPTMSRAELLDDQLWCSYDDFRRVLEAASAQLGGARRLRDLAYVSPLGGGSAPDATAMLRTFGSPDGLMQVVNEANLGICAVERSETEQIGPNEWVHRRRLLDGFEHFPELCELDVAMTGIVPRLFGMRVVELAEDTCRRRGDEWCTTRLRWHPCPTDSSSAEFDRTSLELLESRVATLQRSVAELVSPDELEVVLARVVRSAATAVRSPRFLLVLDPMPWPTTTVYSEGIDDARAAGLAAALRAGTLDEDHVLAVGSARRHHGHLVAVDFPLVEAQRVTLEAYARLAASVLDSAIALEEARRQAATANVLLELSATLDDLGTTEELADRLARAATIVTGADRSTIVLYHPPSNEFRIAASAGYGPEHEHDLAAFAFPAHADLPREIRYVDPTSSPFAGRLLPLGAVATCAVPVVIDGQVVGWIGVDVVEGPGRLSPSLDLEGRLLGLAGQAASALRNAHLVEQIRNQALHDALTGLPNRRMVLERLSGFLREGGGRTPAVLFVDLDDFKDVNDTLGHGVGDELLRAVAQRLSSVVRAEDLIGRLGGDEFVVVTHGGEPNLLAERLLAALAQPFEVSGIQGPLRVTASIGVASGSADATDLLRDADLALYEAKRTGRNRYAYFEEELQQALADRLTMEQAVREAVASEAFHLDYQPIIDVTTGRSLAMEALLRWATPTGPVAPVEFIPVLERCGLIGEVGSWVLRTACRQGAAWLAAGEELVVGVNVSPLQLREASFVDVVAGALEEAGLPADKLVLEVTETAAASDAAALSTLALVRQLGVRVAIDDFGTGYSSLSHLRELPVDILKIDRSFVVGLGADAVSDAILKTFLELAACLGLKVTAEGVETAEQAEVVASLGCQTAQGYFFARPAPPDVVVPAREALLALGGQ